MARILCNVAGGGKPLKGNAETGDVLAGKTFSNKQSNALTGSMPNNGALNVTLTPSGNNSTSQAVAAGYYSGGTITANGSSDTGFKLIVNRVLHSEGGNDSYPGNGEQSYTITATQTTWWCAGAEAIRKSGDAWCSGQGSGILYAGESRTFKANTTQRGGTGSHAFIHIAAWVKA